MLIRYLIKSLLCLSCLSYTVLAKESKTSKEHAYVKNGVVYLANGEELKHFGFNYNAPFAYSNKSILATGADIKQTIDMDIQHMKRIGTNAYRVHVWDREISDADGNILDNAHLELMDYLLAELAKHDIKVILTPIAWWGNGYPAPDTETNGFSNHYSKEQMNTSPEALKATVNYLKQFFHYKNRYTGVKHLNDSNIVLFEFFNEPWHKTPAADSKAYLEALLDAAKEVGVTKPLFYNISEQGDDQAYATAICSTEIDGIAYQWYPTGLVHNSQLNTNLLSTVAHYTNVFAQTKGCENKPKMVYEFDAADVNNSVMYPAMARSFREAGFQWATMFSYDPAVTAHTNVEYNTHNVNLLYTPEKAISYLIASEIFKSTDRLTQVPEFPLSNQFGDTTLDYHKDLSLYSTAQRFYYSTSTEAKPKSVNSLEHIAGTGSSELVQYQGSGAYFLDKQENGKWLLEIYPDVHKLQDPHQSSSLKREITRLYSLPRTIKINLPDLGKRFYITGINEGNLISSVSQGQAAMLTPGKYLLSQSEIAKSSIQAETYYLPVFAKQANSFTHQEQTERNLGDSLLFNAQYYSAQSTRNDVSLFIRYLGQRHFERYQMANTTAGRYQVDLSQDKKWQRAGIVEYFFVAGKEDDTQVTYPGESLGNPNQWDFVAKSEPYRIALKPQYSAVTLFDPQTDRKDVMYPPKGKVQWQFTNGEQGKGTALEFSMSSVNTDDENWLARIGMPLHRSLQHRDLSHINALRLKLKGNTAANEYLTIGLLNEDGLAFGAEVEVKAGWQSVDIPLSSLRPISTQLRIAYPKFMPESFAHSDEYFFDATTLTKIQGIQMAFSSSQFTNKRQKERHTVNIGDILLIKY